MECKFFNPVPIARIKIDDNIFDKVNSLSKDVLSSSNIDYIDSDLTLRGGQQGRIYPNKSTDILWLKEWIENQARIYQIKVCDQAENREALSLYPKLQNCWTIVQPEYSYQVVHTHPFGNISGNLYLELPELSKNSNETDCCISFIFDHSQDLRQLRLRDSLHYRPEIKTMLIFPSWLPHQVYPWSGTGVRRVLAWDCQLLPQ